MEKTELNIRGGSFFTDEIEPSSIFTPEDFTDEHRMIAQTAKQFIEKEVDPFRDEIEQQNFEKIVELLKKAGELGLLAHSVPEQYGGLGLDKITKGLVGESISKTSGYGIAHNNHTCIATLPITYFGTKEQKEKYLPKLASGEYIGAYCLTEPEAGSDSLSSKTTACLNEAGTHYLLNGTKQFITNAVFSDTFIVYAKVDGKYFTAFIVEKDFPGLSLGPEEKKMGIKGSSTRAVVLEDCEVPKENLLGEIGKGHLIALNVLNLGRYNLGSACMGVAKYALELALKYTKERKQFGQSIAEFAASKEKFAKMAARIYAAESVQYRTAGLLENILGDLYDQDDFNLIASRMAEYAIECSICKVYGSETLDYVADESVQLHGGAGYIYEYIIEQVYRDSRINRIFEGTNEINRLILPTHLLRKVHKGVLSLENSVQKAVVDLQKEPTCEFTSPLSREKQAVKTVRNLLLTLVAEASKQYGKEITEEQETLLKLSDIAIHLFSIESTVLRTEKAVTKNGEANEQLKISLCETVVDEALSCIDNKTSELISGMFSGEKRKQFTALVTKAINSLQGEGIFARNRSIAAQLIETERYTC